MWRTRPTRRRDFADADGYREEAAVSAALLPGVLAPRLLLSAALDLLTACAKGLTPAPLDGLPTVAARMAGRCEIWQDPGTATVGEWERDHLPRLAEIEREWQSLVTGDTMLHFDPRFDNILIDEHGTARFVDWRRACVGPAWVDLVCLLPSRGPRTPRTCGSGASTPAAPPWPGSAPGGGANRRRGCPAASRGRARPCE